MCVLVWNGVGWAEQSNTCGPGGVCTVPARDGAYIGEEAHTPCVYLGTSTETLEDAHAPHLTGAHGG